MHEKEPWLLGADRKIHPSGSLFGITQQSLVMPNSYPRKGFSVCTSHSWKILIILNNMHSNELFELRHDKTNKVSVRPAKTQISQDIPQSDQSLHCPHEESLIPWLPIEHTAKTLIRQGGCTGWSESSLDAQSLSWFVMSWLISFKGFSFKKDFVCISKDLLFEKIMPFHSYLFLCFADLVQC